METILVLGDLSATDDTTRYLLRLAERNNVRVVTMTRVEYDNATAATEDSVRRELKTDDVDLSEDWSDEATRLTSERLRQFLASERDLDLKTIKGVIIIPSKDHPIDWWPFDNLTRGNALVAPAHA